MANEVANRAVHPVGQGAVDLEAVDGDLELEYVT
jgi:hypothetical protein